MTEQSEFYDDSAEDDTDDQQEQQGNHNLRQMRKKARDFDTVATERDTLRRENAFLKAGIPDTPQGRLMQKAFDGEPTVEAVRAFAIEHGVIEENSEIPAEEIAAMGRADAASAGGGYTPQKAPDMNEQLRGAFGR